MLKSFSGKDLLAPGECGAELNYELDADERDEVEKALTIGIPYDLRPSTTPGNDEYRTLDRLAMWQQNVPDEQWGQIQNAIAAFGPYKDAKYPGN